MTPIPAVIKRNMWFIAATQVAVGTANQLTPTLGALIVVRLSGSTGLAGSASATLGLGRMLVAYAVGSITDRYGRKSGLFLGLSLSLIGAMVVGLSVLASHLGLFFVGLLIFAFGSGAVAQLRVAAADMFPPSRRGEGIGFLLTASLVGAFGGLGLVSLANRLSDSDSLDAMALTWLLTPIVIVPAIIFVFLIRPDPLYISANLKRYYPDYEVSQRESVRGSSSESGFRVFVRDYPMLTAFVTYFAVHGNMSMMMAITSLVLREHGHGLTAISLAVALHVVGMFGPSLPMGSFSDRIGRRWVMLFGVCTAASGSVLVVATPLYGLITAGLVLVGVGWSAVNVAAVALIADRTSAVERGRAIGASDTFSGAASITLPLIAGPLAAAFGLVSVGIFAMLLMVLPMVLLLRLGEPRPGRYAIDLAAQTIP